VVAGTGGCSQSARVPFQDLLHCGPLPSSILQCLSHTTPLRDLVLSGDYKQIVNVDNPLGSRGELVEEFASIVRQCWRGDRAFFSPREMKDLLGRLRDNFQGYDQQDAQEALSMIVDYLMEDTNLVTGPKPVIELNEKSEDETDLECGERFWNDNLKRTASPVLDLFYGLSWSAGSGTLARGANDVHGHACPGIPRPRFSSGLVLIRSFRGAHPQANTARRLSAPNATKL